MSDLRPLPTQARSLWARSVGDGGRVEEIAANLADIDEQRATLADHVVPEPARRKTLPDVAGAAKRQRRARRDQAAVGVVHRKKQIDPIVGASIDRRPDADHDAQHARMGDARRFGLARRARGVNVKRVVADDDLRTPARLQRRAGNFGDGEVEARVVVARIAMRPNSDGIGERRARAGEGRRAARVNDRGLHFDRVDAMGERGPAEVGVDERDGDAYARQAEPDRQVFRRGSASSARRRRPWSDLWSSAQRA